MARSRADSSVDRDLPFTFRADSQRAKRKRETLVTWSPCHLKKPGASAGLPTPSPGRRPCGVSRGSAPEALLLCRFREPACSPAARKVLCQLSNKFVGIPCWLHTAAMLWPRSTSRTNPSLRCASQRAGSSSDALREGLQQRHYFLSAGWPLIGVAQPQAIDQVRELRRSIRPRHASERCGAVNKS